MSLAVKRVKNLVVRALYALTIRNTNIPQFSPRLSVRKMIKIKIGIIVRYLVESILAYGSEKHSLDGIRDYSKLAKNSSALLIANGPSAKKLNLSEVRKYKNLGELEVFGVNFSILDPNYEDIIDYLVLSDPGMHPNSDSSRAIQLWKRIQDQNRIKIITPSSWHPFLKQTICKSSGCLHFKDSSLEGFTLNIDPTKPRGYVSLTAYKALAVAIFFKYQRIFVIGLDNSMFRNIAVNEKNELTQFSNHGIGIYPSSENLSSYFNEGIFDYFYDLSEAFRSLKFCFGQFPITNLGLNSEVDCFPKIDAANRFYSLITENTDSLT